MIYKEIVDSVLTGWRIKNVPIWPENFKRIESRTKKILQESLEQGKAMHFFAPVCPDYPLDVRTKDLGIGIGESVKTFLPFLKEIIEPLRSHSLPFKFYMILADTETDLPEVVKILAGNSIEFSRRCNESVKNIQKIVPDGIEVAAFSDFFKGNWHKMQYFWQEIILQLMQENKKFLRWIRLLADMRIQKYVQQFGRELNSEERLEIAVRHYSQYSALGYYMRQEGLNSIMINTESPNLRAVRKPYIPKELQGNENFFEFLLPVRDPYKKIPIIVGK